MNLVDYGYILLRRGWIMILLAVLAAGGAYVLSQQMIPVYRSTQVVLMIPSRSDWGLTQAAAQILDQRAAYLQSDLRAEEVINNLALDMTPGALRGATTITVRSQDLTIRIDVDMQAPDDQTAAQLINPISQEWGTLLIDWQNALNQEAERTDRVRAEFQDRPSISKLRPNMMINTAIGGIGGFLLGAVIVFVLEFLEANMVRRAADVERSGDLRVLATVPGE
ncbi:MAG: hypothetical protein CL607_01220 [Anaerolineaceae bacterium]|nr:hypothetical protein [Anaerolineaceae bacterium]